MKEKLLNSYLYVFDNEPYEITTEANGIYIQEECVKGFAYINPSLVDKMIPINYYTLKVNTPEWYSYMVSTDPQPAPLGPDPGIIVNPELIVEGNDITVSEYGNNFKLFDNPNNIEGVIYSSTDENVAYFSSEQEGEVVIVGPGETVLSQDFDGNDEYLPFSQSYNLEVEDITVDPEIAWSQNSATVQIGETNSFPTISNPHGVGLTFASSDGNVATVDPSTGAITLVAAGNCTISCTSIQDADYYSSTVEYSLTVLAAKVDPNLSWSFSPCTARIGEQNNMPVLVNPDNLEVVISSSDTQVAVIDQSDNEVLLHAPGTCYITASFAGNAQYNAYTISYELTVLAAKIDPDLHYSGANGNYDLYTHVETIPSLVNSYNVSPITYVSSDTTVATVNPDGIINYLAVGSTSISASFAGNSTYEADTTSFTLIISDSTPQLIDPNLSFSQPSDIAEIGQPYSGLVLNNPYNVSVLWESTSPSVASIDQQTGVITINTEGNTTIRAYFNGDSIYQADSAQYILNVEQHQMQYPVASWSGVSNNEIVLNYQHPGTINIPFTGTPASGWSFTDPMVSGISVDTSTGAVSITGSNLTMSGRYYVYANYPGDSSYYMGSGQLMIRVLAQGQNNSFYFDQDIVNLNNQSSGSMQLILINNGYSGHEVYSSGDNSIAAVDQTGFVQYVGPGTTTITATITDGQQTATATVSVICEEIKEWPQATWTDGVNQVYDLTAVAGSANTYNLTFNGTPASGWTFTDPLVGGITVNTSTGAISVDPSIVSAGQYYVSYNYPEDSQYYSSMGQFMIRILPSGSDIDFYYEQSSVNLDNQAMTQITPMLHNSTGIMATPTYTSANTSVATVDAYGMISFAGAGTTSITATITDGVNTHTATITVNCTVNYTASMYYTNGVDDYPQGYFDMNILEYGQGSVRIVVELTGPEITNSSSIYSYLNFDSTYSATQCGSLTIGTTGASVNYQNGVNIITLPLELNWDGSTAGTDRYIFTLQYGGVNYIENERILVYFDQAC